MSDISAAPPEETPAISNTQKRTSFSLDLIKVVSGTTIAQIIGVLASPIIARLYNPDAFGIVALLTSIIGIITSVYTLEYEVAIVLPKKPADAANLLIGTLGITVLITLATIPVIWFGGPVFAGWLNAPELASYLWLIPLFLLFGGIGAGHPVLNAWASRARYFKEVSISRVVSVASSVVLKISAGFWGMNSPSGLLGGTLLGSVVPPAMLGWHIWRHDRNLFLENIHWQGIQDNLKRYRKFVTYNTPSALLNTISWQVPSFFLSVFFSPTVVGYYAFSNQLLRMPMNLIGGSIAQVFYSHASKALHDGKLAELVEVTFRRLVEYSFLPILMLMLVGKELVTVIFGAQWAEAGIYIQILSPWMIFWFISSPMSQLYSVLEKNELILKLNIVILVTRIASVWLGGVMGQPRAALAFFSISGAVVYGYLSLSITYLAGVSWHRIGRILFWNLSLFVLAGGGILLLKLIHTPDWVQVIVAAILVSGYFAYRFKDEIRYRIVPVLRNIKKPV